MHEGSISPFLSLPEDILLRILLNLSADDISRCRQTCKLMSELSCTRAVRYKVELDAMGLVDSITATLPMAERHDRLVLYRNAWRNASFAWDRNFPAHRRPECWNWTGGVLPYVLDPESADEAALHLYRPASPGRGTAEFIWSLPRGTVQAGYGIYGCVVDISQDLLALALVPGPLVEQGTWKLQLVSISKNGVPHTEASSPLLDGPLFHSRPRPKACVMRVSGNTIGLQMMNHSWELLVWDWKESSLLWHSRRIDFLPFILPSPSYMIVMPTQQMSERILQVYRLDVEAEPFEVDSKARDRDPMATLRLFAFADGLFSDAELIPPNNNHDISTDRPSFKHQTDQTIFALYLHLQNIAIGHANFGHVEKFLLLISIPSILKRLDHIRGLANPDTVSTTSTPASARVVEWDEWGSTDTRLIALTGAFPWRGRVRTCGSRCAVQFGPDPRSNQDCVRVILVDAHPAAPCIPNEGLEQARRALNLSQTIASPRLFKEPVRTTLPIRISYRELRPPVPEPIAVGLLGDGLVFRYRPSVHIHPPEGGLFGFYV
ncbi:hypothetical protein BD311DRAFT_702282 [Dichomitus squalens]|uniref:F-box domain-containing protein n=1 Tax=Dichomitus squalens TaxID=114155 RepID=A0A4Q9MEM8_9APHY|nr:hypothetical protein BD311DRAFT_702282 [Dichomitus squalens]